MKDKLSIITPYKIIKNKKIALERQYSQFLYLADGMTLSYASNIGYKENQEDCLAISYRDNLILLLVADGMGGLEQGELSSYYTAKTIQKWFETENIDTIINFDEKSLKKELIKMLCTIIMDLPKKSGTTLNASIILPDKTFIINIGDSRTYTIKNKEISLRTKDDSLAFKQFTPITQEERDTLRFYKKNNIILNAVSPKRIPNINVYTIKNNEYDSICHLTDGISDILKEQDIETYCQSPNPALTLVSASTYGKKIENNYYENHPEYFPYIYPGKDNATAIVYTKKLIKNN